MLVSWDSFIVMSCNIRMKVYGRILATQMNTKAMLKNHHSNLGA